MTSDRFQLFPGLVRSVDQRGLTVTNPVLQTQVGLSPDFRSVLQFFQRPRTLAQFEEKFGVGAGALALPFRNAILGQVTPDGLRPMEYVAARRALVGQVDAPQRSTPARRRLPRFGDRLRLGKSGLRISPYMLGIAKSVKQVTDAYEQGVNAFFLTADVHWPAYEPLRRGLRKILSASPSTRDDIVVAVTTYGKGPVALREVLAAVPELRRIDTLIIGAAEAYDFDVRRPLYEGVQKQGNFGVGALGCSFHDVPTCQRALDESLVDLALVRYSPARPTVSELRVPRAGKVRPLLYAFKTRAGSLKSAVLKSEQLGLPKGAWRPTVTDYYRFALSRPQFDGILFSAVGDRLDALREASESQALTPEEELYLTHLFKLARWSVSPDFRGYESSGREE